jgi:RNA polymerase sigma-70 factor (ECF subfamily)
VAFVSGYSAAANALYQSVMGDDYDVCAPWVRQWLAEVLRNLAAASGSVSARRSNDANSCSISLSTSMNEHLELLWNQYSRQLRAFIRGRVGNDADAQDILQEVFIRIHRNLCCLPESEWHRPESWIYQITRNLIIDQYRRRRELEVLPENLPAHPDLPETDPQALLALSLRELIDQLPEPYRQALILTEYQGLSQRQLAERIGISLSGAKSRV